MRRLIPLLLASAAVAAAVRLLARRKPDRPSRPEPSVMPRPTARTVSEEEPMHEEPAPEQPAPDPTPDDTPGRISEGEPGAITAAPVPEEPDPEPAPAPDDSELERAVEAEIVEDPAVPEENVEVDVEGGVARLTGNVPDDQTAIRIGDDAARVDGIIGLDDNLERGEAAADEPEAPADEPEAPADEPEAPAERPADSPE